MKRGDVVRAPHRDADRPSSPSGVRNRSHLKRRLIAAGLKENRCENEDCGLAEWRGKPLSMALHHVNGDGSDNRLENLRMLCPNCHSQTENFAGRNRKRPRRAGGNGVLIASGRLRTRQNRADCASVWVGRSHDRSNSSSASSLDFSAVPSCPARTRWASSPPPCSASPAPLVGFLLFTEVLGIGDNKAFDLGGLIGAVIGVMLLLGLYRAFVRDRGARGGAAHPAR